MNFGSVRARITMVSTALVAVTLVLASLLLVRLVRDDLLASAQETLDLALAEQAERFGLESFEEVPSFDLAAQIDGSWVEVGLFDAGADGLLFGEVFIDDQVVALIVLDPETGEMEQIFDPFTEAPLQDPEVRDELESLVFDTFQLTEDADGRFLVGATPLDEIEESVAAIGEALTVIVPALILLFGLSTWLLVGRALRPVMSITDQVEAISTSSLDQRVPVPRTGDEVAELAVVMNGMLDRLQRGGERQRQFSADASHELRSPLSTIRIAAEVLTRHPEPDRVERLAEDIVAESDRMNVLIGDLLELSRLDEDRCIVALEPVDMARLVRDELRSEVAKQEVKLVTTQTAMLNGSSSQLRRLVRNVVDNASRHAESQVLVELLVSDDGSVQLVVDDDGPGVPPESRAVIFERFARLDDARAREVGGAGLGLALVKAIAEHHQAAIVVEDAPLGGARFLITFPMPPAP